MSAPIRVAIRADAGPAFGTGHFARASAVAEDLLAGGGAEIALVTNPQGAELVPAYFPADITLVVLASNEEDPVSTMRALRDRGWTPEVIYLDHYGLVSEWEAHAAEAGARLLVIDDLDQAMRADVIVRPHGRHVANGTAVVLHGPAYLPLSRYVTSARHRSPEDQNAPLRLNICFGGSDPTGETAKALLAVANLDALQVDAVLGPGAQLDPFLADTTEGLAHVTLHRSPSRTTLAELLTGADLAVGAGGVMLWERMYLGVPSLVIATAPNQRPQIDAMAAAGAIRFLGDHREVTTAGIAEAVLALAADETARRALAESGRKLVDGRGASRLAAWIKALALGVRNVRSDDARDLLNWRTDERNWQHNWADAQQPDFDTHVAWLAEKLAEPTCVFRIVTRMDKPAGVVRFDLNVAGTSAYLSIYLVPAWHGQRMGLAVYLAAERALRASHPGVRCVVSQIDGSNVASHRLHRDAGFDTQLSQERAGWLDAWKVLA